MIKEVKVKSWRGVRNCDTKQVEHGHLYIEIIEDVTLMIVSDKIIGAKPMQYYKGDVYGLGITAKNRKEAISVFERDYQIIK